METISKEQIFKQAKIVENYQGNESDILGAEKGGKFHGFIAGAEWAIQKLEAEKKEMVEILITVRENYYSGSINECLINNIDEIESLIQKMKQ